MRTLDSHLAYYDRWAKSWEFQALLKARPIAGDAELGDAYVERRAAEDLDQRRARELRGQRAAHAGAGHRAHPVRRTSPYQLKLGPGGIRDIEFTVQLLQLVHGLTDAGIRQRGTLDALDALVNEGYIGRNDAAIFARDYRTLRLLEHRLQLQGLSRTHLMPRTPDGLRVLARASGIAESGPDVWALWESVKREVREIHVRLFYRPLLSAVASLPEEQRSLSTEQAHDRLAAIGFRDPAGALRHIAALTSGLSRKATIQRHLMPVMIQWFADGVDPDYGLLAFRRISERLGNMPWFLRMLRDSSAAGESLTRVLSGSRYIGELMEWIPESVAWLDSDEHLQPAHADGRCRRRRAPSRRATTRSTTRCARCGRCAAASCCAPPWAACSACSRSRRSRRRSRPSPRSRSRRPCGRCGARSCPPEDGALDFAVIAMGRFGGAELGFGSDADVMYVYNPNGVDPQRAQELSLLVVSELRRHSEDHRLPLDLDAGLRPEGRNGPMARSLEAYTEYYRRWSLSWEAQALLRARGVAGSVKLIRAFMEVADGVRYPAVVDPQGLREIKRIKARVENERLPQGVERTRHLKLGPGSLSDVEWLVQLWQLEHGHAHHRPADDVDHGRPRGGRGRRARHATPGPSACARRGAWRAGCARPTRC